MHLQGILAAIGATILLVGTGIWLADAPEPPAETDDRPTALADYDTTAVALARGPFCDLVADDAATHALGGEATDTAAWGDGDRLPDVGIVHEYGCRMSGDQGADTATAWVLAPPVATERARRLVRDATRDPDCRARPDAPAYGAPSVALLCTTSGGTAASYRGLFGDAWLTCTLTRSPRLPYQELLERAGVWCVAVAEAARR